VKRRSDKYLELEGFYQSNRVLLYILGVLFIIFILLEFNRSSDFRIFVEASRELLEKKDFYSHHFDPNITKKDSILYYYYSPLFALIIAPFSFLPHPIIYILWKLLNLFFLFRIWKIAENMLGLNTLDKKLVNKITLFSFLFISFFIYFNFHNLQMTIFLLYLSLEGIHAIEDEEKILKGALLISIAINVKLLTLVMVPYLFYRNQIKSVVLIVLFSIVLLFLPALFIGWDYNLAMIRSWWNLLQSYSQLKFIDKDVQSLTALIPILLTEVEDKNQSVSISRNILFLDQQLVNYISIIVRGLLVLFTLYFLRTRPFTKGRSKIHEFWEVSYIMAIIPLIFPQQRGYSFLLVFPAIIYLVNYYFNLKAKPSTSGKQKHLSLLTIFALPVFLLFNLELILGNFREYYWYFKTITWGALFLLVLLTVCTPWEFNLTNPKETLKNG
jgi:hypothetical protein